MKVTLATFVFSGALLGLAACSTQTVHQDPYAVNHAAPALEERAPASQDGAMCEDVVAQCQAGDSYASDSRTPASAGGACKQDVYECQSSSVRCKDSNGTEDTVDTMKYVSVTTRDCQ